MSRFVLPASMVMVPPRLARRLSELLAADRVRMRGDDAELDELLLDLHTSGLRWQEDNEGNLLRRRADKQHGGAAVCASSEGDDEDLSVADAAVMLNIGGRAVCDAFHRGRLAGRRVGGRQVGGHVKGGVLVFSRVAVDEYARTRRVKRSA